MTDEEMIEQVARAIEPHLAIDEALLASPQHLRKLKARRTARAALAAINLPAQLDEEYSRGWSDATQSATTALQAFDATSYTQGWNEAIEAAAEAFEAEAETWLQLPARGSCSRLGAQAIRALTKEKDDETR